MTGFLLSLSAMSHCPSYRFYWQVVSGSRMTFSIWERMLLSLYPNVSSWPGPPSPQPCFKGTLTFYIWSVHMQGRETFHNISINCRVMTDQNTLRNAVNVNRWWASHMRGKINYVINQKVVHMQAHPHLSYCGTFDTHELFVCLKMLRGLVKDVLCICTEQIMWILGDLCRE